MEPSWFYRILKQWFFEELFIERFFEKENHNFPAVRIAADFGH